MELSVLEMLIILILVSSTGVLFLLMEVQKSLIETNRRKRNHQYYSTVKHIH